MKQSIHVEYYGKKVDTKDLVEETKLLWKEKGGKIKDIHHLDIYYKPEEGMCYFVINKTETGHFPV